MNISPCLENRKFTFIFIVHFLILFHKENLKLKKKKKYNENSRNHFFLASRVKLEICNKRLVIANNNREQFRSYKSSSLNNTLVTENLKTACRTSLKQQSLSKSL